MEKLRELFVLLGMKTDEASFTKAILNADAIKATLNTLVQVVESVAKAMVGAVVDTAREGAAVSDMAARTGVAAQTLMGYAVAAKLAGAELGDVAQGMRGLANSMQGAKDGSEAQQKAFAKLGVKVTDASGKMRPLNDVMDDVADGLERMGPSSERLAIAQDVLGKSGGALIPMLEKGSKGLREMRKRAEELGLVMDEDTRQAMTRMDDALDTLELAMQGLRTAIVGPLLKPLAQLVEKVNEWIIANRKVIAAGLGRVFTIVGKAVAFVGAMLRPVLALFEWLLEQTWMFDLLGVAIGGVAIALGAVAAGAGLVGLVLLPVLALAGALAGALAVALAAIPILLALVVADIYAFIDGGPSIFGLFVNGLALVGKKVGETLKEWFTVAIDFWKTQFAEFFGWLLSKFDALPGPLKAAAGALAAASPVGQLAQGVADVRTMADYFGEGPQAVAAKSVSNQSASTVNKPSFNAQINFNGPLDAQGAQNSLLPFLDSWWEQKTSEAFAATPLLPGVG